MLTRYKIKYRPLIKASLFTLMCSKNICFSQEAPSLDFNYTIDSSFIYTDRLKRSNTSGDEPPKFLKDNLPFYVQPIGLAGNSSSTNRTLGLRHLKIGVSISKIRSSTLQLVFRPDADLRKSDSEDGEPREFDTRSGIPYRKKEKINLLDSYILTIHKGDNLDISYGVFEKMTPSHSAYHQTLEFGLTTQLPSKYLGLELMLKSGRFRPPLAREKRGRENQYSFIVYEGRGDRGETITSSLDTQDKIAVADDPYRGIAVKINYYSSPITEYTLIGGYDSSKETSSKTEIYTNLAASTHFKLFEKLCKIS